jgi:hypothetical protein
MLSIYSIIFSIFFLSFFRCSGGPAMAWSGMVDSDINAGYMHIIETAPFFLSACYAETNRQCKLKNSKRANSGMVHLLTLASE